MYLEWTAGKRQANEPVCRAAGAANREIDRFVFLMSDPVVRLLARLAAGPRKGQAGAGINDVTKMKPPGRIGATAKMLRSWGATSVRLTQPDTGGPRWTYAIT